MVEEAGVVVKIGLITSSAFDLVKAPKAKRLAC